MSLCSLPRRDTSAARQRRLFALAVCAAAIFVAAKENTTFANVTTIQVHPATDSGWYWRRATGYLHQPSNTNFIVGHESITPTEYRDFFVFDLSSVSGHITAATFKAELTYIGEVQSPGPVRTWTLRDVTTSISDLRNAATPAASFDDLATGLVFGEFQFPLGTGPTVTVPLNNVAIAAMNSAGGLWAFGGSVNNTSEIYDMLFNGSGEMESHPRLELTVPEPRCITLLGVSLLAFLGRYEPIARSGRRGNFLRRTVLG